MPPLFSTNTEKMAETGRTQPTSSVDLPSVLWEYRDLVENALREEIPKQNSAPYTSLRYHMGWCDKDGNPRHDAEGKRLRPALLLLTCQASGGAIESAMAAASAMELIHNFSLIHDDIEDRDVQRHHRPTLWAIWGEPKALTAGSVMFNLAFLALSQSRKVPGERLLYASSRLTQSSLEMIEGQYLDISFEQRLDVTTGEYMDMISRKTGALISCALEVGAFIGSGDREMASLMAQAGRYLGNLFQIRDDILGVWGDPSVTGKGVGSDILRKKKSFPVVHALENGSDSTIRGIKEVLGKDSIDEADVQQVLDMLEKTGSKERAESLTEELGRQAMETIGAAELPPDHHNHLRELVAFLLTRTR